MERNVKIVQDENGRKIVVIRDIRYAEDKQMYLYDIIDIKKETSNSFKQL